MKEGTVCNRVPVVLKRQLAGVGSLLSLCEFEEWSGHQTPQQAL